MLNGFPFDPFALFNDGAGAGLSIHLMRRLQIQIHIAAEYVGNYIGFAGEVSCNNF